MRSRRWHAPEQPAETGLRLGSRQPVEVLLNYAATWRRLLFWRMVRLKAVQLLEVKEGAEGLWPMCYWVGTREQRELLLIEDLAVYEWSCLWLRQVLS
jgi:hypothetical protein